MVQHKSSCISGRKNNKMFIFSSHSEPENAQISIWKLKLNFLRAFPTLPSEIWSPHPPETPPGEIKHPRNTGNREKCILNVFFLEKVLVWGLQGVGFISNFEVLNPWWKHKGKKGGKRGKLGWGGKKKAILEKYSLKTLRKKSWHKIQTNCIE